MSATAAIEIGSARWNARVYAGLSVASELAAELDEPRSASLSLVRVFAIYWAIGRLNRTLEEVLTASYQVIEGKKNNSTSAQPSQSAYRSARDTLMHLYPLPSLFMSLPGHFPDHRLLRGRLVRLKRNTEHLLDVADWLDAMSAPDETNAKFDAALADLASGNVVPWAAVQ